MNCPINQNCTIICNQTESCKSSTFNVYNHTKIICTEYQSCYQIEIIGTDVQSLTITFNGDESGKQSNIIIDNSDGEIYIHCNSDVSDGMFLSTQCFCIDHFL